MLDLPRGVHWERSIPFLCPSELESDEPYPTAGAIMSQPNQGTDFDPHDGTMDLIREVFGNEMSYTRRSGHPNARDVRLLRELLDQSIHARSIPNWQEQMSRRLKAVAWRFRVQECFLDAAMVLAQQGLIEPNFRTALKEPMDVSSYRTHPSVHAVETTLRRFDKAWRIVTTRCFPDEYRFRRHLASPYSYTFSWLATVIARSATSTSIDPIIDVLDRSQIFGQLVTLTRPPVYGVQAWQPYAATGVSPSSPPGAPAREWNGSMIRLIDIVYRPVTRFLVDPAAGRYPESDPRARGGRFRGAALNFWLPSTGMGEGDEFVTEIRRYMSDLRHRRQVIKLAFEEWFGEGSWGDDRDAEETLDNFEEAATEGQGAGEEVDDYESEDEEEGQAARAAEMAELQDIRDDAIEPFPPYPFQEEEYDSGSEESVEIVEYVNGVYVPYVPVNRNRTRSEGHVETEAGNIQVNGLVNGIVDGDDGYGDDAVEVEDEDEDEDEHEAIFASH